jgi:hypothetical protein
MTLLVFQLRRDGLALAHPGILCLTLAVLWALFIPVSVVGATLEIRATRPLDAPIVHPAMLPGTDGENINGPSMIRVPSWVKNPLGKYYLYFSHHNGKYLRLAYADSVAGPWKIHAPGVLQLTDQNAVKGHVASPEVVVDEARRQLVLFYHGNHPAKRPSAERVEGEETPQLTAVAFSNDGLQFTATNIVVGPAYLRVFQHRDRWYALNHSGDLRSAPRFDAPFATIVTIIGPEIEDEVDPARRGEPGATPAENRPPNGPFRYSIRHIGTDVWNDRLIIYFSCAGHRPERILATVVDLKGPPEKWRAQGVIEVLRPERDWEGGHLPLAYSRGGVTREKVNQLRDPAVYREGGDAWLIYSIAGENGLGLARLEYALKSP